MTTIHLHETTTATPEQFVAGLTDFGPGRSELFGRSADDYLEVHDQGPGYADVTEGSAGGLGTPALRLVGSEPRRPHDHRLQHVGRQLGPHLHLHAATERHDGRRCRRGARRQELQRTRARALLGIAGKRVLGQGLGQTVKAIEARNAGVPGGQP